MIVPAATRVKSKGRKGISIAAEDASILRDPKNHAYVWFLAHKEELKLAIGDAKLVAAKVAPLKITLAEVKIHNTHQNIIMPIEGTLIMKMINLMVETDVAVNA